MVLKDTLAKFNNASLIKSIVYSVIIGVVSLSLTMSSLWIMENLWRSQTMIIILAPPGTQLKMQKAPKAPVLPHADTEGTIL